MKYVVEEEYRAKRENARLLRRKRANLPELWEMETFPFHKQPKLDQRRVMSLYDSFDYMTKLQSNLRHLLLSMFLLSVAMAPARLVLPEEGTFHLPDDYGIWIVLAGVAICNVVVTVPCIWGAFSTKHVPLQLAIGWPIYCALAADDLRNRRLAPFRSHPADSAWTTHWCHFQFTAFLNRGFQG